jgi:23S rRNA pseudouridine955/2504/2580 synthase
MILELEAGENDEGRRLDRILRKALPDHSLSHIHRLLRQGKVLVNGKAAGPEQRIMRGSVISISTNTPVNHQINQVNETTALPVSSLPDILWRGSGIIVFNKPRGLAIHGKQSMDTIVNSWLAGKVLPSLSFKPGPLHRLDKPTSGAIVFSETLEGARLFSSLMREHKIIKTYLALAEGCMKSKVIWYDELVRNKKFRKTFVKNVNIPADDETAEPKEACTAARVIASNDIFSLVEFQIITGRTHQIRAQAAAHGHPLAGDLKYGGSKINDGFFLHAWKIEFTEPAAGFPRQITAPVPELFQKKIETLF